MINVAGIFLFIEDVCCQEWEMKKCI